MKVSYTGLFTHHAELLVDYLEAVSMNCVNAAAMAKKRLMENVEMWTDVLGSEFGNLFKKHVLLVKEYIDASFSCHCKTAEGTCEYALKMKHLHSCLIANGEELSKCLAHLLCYNPKDVHCKFMHHIECTVAYICVLAHHNNQLSREYTCRKITCLMSAFDFGEYLDGVYDVC